MPRAIYEPPGNRTTVELPPAEIFSDDLLDIVEILRRHMATEFEIDAFEARWDAIEHVIERAGQRVAHAIRIAAKPSENNADVEFVVWPARAVLMWTRNNLTSKVAAGEIREIIDRRRRTGLSRHWNKVVGHHSTIHFTPWGTHQGFVAKNRDAILVIAGVVLGSIATVIATAIVNGSP